MFSRRFQLSDQLSFAELSGDHNPLHVDPLAARRLLAGEPVVHGVHLLLVTLAGWLAEHSVPPAITLRTLVAKFRRPAVIGRVVEFHVHDAEPGRVSARLRSEGNLLATIDFTWEPATLQEFPSRSRPSRGDCRHRPVGKLAGATGSLDLLTESSLVERTLPGLVRRVPEPQLAQLIATSRLVGMECPGLNSIYGELHADFAPASGAADRLEYAVTEYNDRYHTVTMSIRSAGLSGRIHAFVRPEPVAQPGSAELRSRVAPTAFAGQRALVIGGSRGIGEVTAKLLALGGADVRLTFSRGREDAAAVVADIVAAGCRADAFAYDVLRPDDTLRRELGTTWPPTHLYYFATPPLVAGSIGTFSHERFLAFSQFYVTGFADAVYAVRGFSPELRGVFYPSTVALDGPPGSMAEYAAAKAAGEALCDYFRKHIRGIAFYKTRLPRISTDLTATVLPVKTEDVVDAMLDRLGGFLRG